MPPLQVRDLPQGIYEKFKRITELEHRSLAQQTIVALEYYLENHEVRDGKVIEIDRAPAVPVPFVPFERDGVTYMVDPGETPEQRKARLTALFNRINSRPPLPVLDGYESVVDMIRDMREERASHIMQVVEEGPWQ